jgi:hypothetical protein
MLEYRRVRDACRGLVPLCVICLVGVPLLSGCSDFRQMVGLDQPMPDEFAVESRAPLTIPPDFDLRPPEPGAPRPQEKTAEQQAEQVIDQAGPGKPGDQAADFRLHASAAGLPNLNPPAPDQSPLGGSQSLSNQLLGYSDTGNTGATVDQRDTTPLKGVY